METTLALASARAFSPNVPIPSRRGPDAGAAATHEVRFGCLFREGSALAFPCDGGGRVDLDGLSDRARNNYLFARAMVGRDFALPVVRPIPPQ